MNKFRNDTTLQKFASVQSQVQNHFNGERHLINRETYRDFRSTALAEWRSLAA